MANPLNIEVRETIEELKKLLKRAKPMMVPRIQMLIEIKKNSPDGISKRELAERIGVNHNSIQSWRKIYLKNGIEMLLSNKMKGNRPAIITEQEHQYIENILKNPTNGLRGYKELLTWVEKEFQKEVKYNTLFKYCTRHFGSKIKVARKSHVKKDMQAVDTFKKTSF